MKIMMMMTTDPTAMIQKRDKKELLLTFTIQFNVSFGHTETD